MNNIRSVSCGSFKEERGEVPGADHYENERSELPHPDSERLAQEDEQRARAKQTWDNAVHSWSDLFNSQFSWENTRRRYGQVVRDAVNDKIDALNHKIDDLQDFSSRIGGSCCGARKREKDSLGDHQINPDEVDNQDGDWG